MARAKNKRKTPKKFQFQMGWGGMMAFTTATLCILLWIFVLGFWAGKRFSGGAVKATSNQTALALNQDGKAASKAPSEEEPVWPGPWSGASVEEQPVEEERVGSEDALVPAPIARAEKQVEEKVEQLREKLELKPETEHKKVKPEQATEPAEKKEAVAKPKPKKKVGKKEVQPQGPFFALQIASYKQKSRAQQEAGRWRKKGYQTTVKKVNLGARKGTWYRVYIGRFDTATEAKAFAVKLAKSENLRAYVVPVRP